MKKKFHKINSEVRFPSVRLVGEKDSIIISSREAYEIAIKEGKDLILINEDAKPPVVRIEEYSRFLYNQEKLQKDRNKKNPPLKEVQLSVNISDHDLKIKSKKSEEFLSSGHKVKCVLLMKGRENARPETAEIVVLKFLESIQEKGVPESMPRLDGKRWTVIIKPKKIESSHRTL